MIKLKKGMIVMTKRGKVRLDNRNGGSNSWMWCATPIINGKARRNSFRLVTNEDVIAIKDGDDFRTLLPGMLPSERPQ